MTKGGGEVGGCAGGGPGYVTELREGSHNNMANLTVSTWGVCIYRNEGVKRELALTRKRR